MRPRLAFAVLLLLLQAVPVEVGAQGPAVEYELQLSCPGGGIYISTNVGPGCPIRAVDGDDLMGDPSLAVDPLQPEELILASLHGCAPGATCALAGACAGDVPHSRARCGQVFTTFTSTDQGASWVDSPYYPPEDIDEGNGAFGIHPQVTIDPYGQVYIGSLYARPYTPDANATADDFLPRFEYVIGAQKFESIQTIREEQADSDGAYNAEYVTPVYLTNQVNQMWFLFNPVTDNMTMVWHESVPRPGEPVCDTDSAYLVDAAGFYVKANALAQTADVYQETNGLADLQTQESCPLNPDSRMLLPPASQAAPAVGTVAPRPATAPVAAAAAAQVPAPQPSGASRAGATAAPGAPAAPLASSIGAVAAATSMVGAPAGAMVATAAEAALGASVVPVASAPAPAPPMPAGAAVAARPSASLAAVQPPPNETAEEQLDRPKGAIGVVWTTADADTPYYYQDLEDTIMPCSGSTNPVLSYGWLYIGCIVDTSEGTFRWAPEAANGTVHLFRMDPDGGAPEYMGQAPEMVGAPKLGVRSDGRLALVAAAASDEGALRLSAAFGRYDDLVGKIDWTTELALGQDVLPLDPEKLVVRAAVQDMLYREQTGALHIILKFHVQYAGGTDDLLDGTGLLPHIQKMIVAIDELYGVLDTLPLVIGDPQQRNADATIASAPETAFDDLSDDFLLLPAEPYTFNGKDFGDAYQREFFAIADYGTVLFAEIIENTTLRAVLTGMPPAPPPPSPAPVSVNLVAPAAGLVGVGSVVGLITAHRRKNPLAAFTKGE